MGFATNVSAYDEYDFFRTGLLTSTSAEVEVLKFGFLEPTEGVPGFLRCHPPATSAMLRSRTTIASVYSELHVALL